MSSSDEEVGLFPIDRGEAKKAISDLIKKEGLTTLTSSKIRAYLKSRFNEDFDNFRKDVDNLTKQAIEEMDNAEDKTIGKESVSEELSTKKDYGGGSDSDDTSDPGVVDDMRSPRKKKSSKRKATESGNGDEQDEDENMDLMTAVKHRRRAAANRAQQAFRKSAGTVKSKWEKKDPTKVKDNSGKFGRMTKLCLLSEELQSVTGQRFMKRCDVVSKMWEYIRANNLFDPKDKRFAFVDDRLRGVFGTAKRFRTFSMTKQLAKHIKDPEFLGGEIQAEALAEQDRLRAEWMARQQLEANIDNSEHPKHQESTGDGEGASKDDNEERDGDEGDSYEESD